MKINITKKDTNIFTIDKLEANKVYEALPPYNSPCRYFIIGPNKYIAQSSPHVLYIHHSSEYNEDWRFILTNDVVNITIGEMNENI